MPKYWGKGYATEIPLVSLIRLARSVEKLKQLTAEVHPDNKSFHKNSAGFAWSHKMIEDDSEPTEHYVAACTLSSHFD